MSCTVSYEELHCRCHIPAQIIYHSKLPVPPIDERSLLNSIGFHRMFIGQGSAVAYIGTQVVIYRLIAQVKCAVDLRHHQV